MGDVTDAIFEAETTEFSESSSIQSSATFTSYDSAAIPLDHEPVTHNHHQHDTCCSTTAQSDEPQLPGIAAGKRGEGAYGCSHYRRRCKLVSPCCQEVFWCRHCHNHAKMDEEQVPSKQHQLDRTQVKEVICALCNLQQPIAGHCVGCGTSFGVYSCLKCSFFEDEPDKGQFHCDDCGICRVGGPENFFHCKKCACCYHVGIKGKHTCVENSMHSNCPVCFEFLFDSCVPTSVLRCGHTIHSACLQALIDARQTTCPICMRSYSNMSHVWKRMDLEIAHQQMPAEYVSWTVDVLCNDCHSESNCRFHIVGLKCNKCGSYNTRRLRVNAESTIEQPHEQPVQQTNRVCNARARSSTTMQDNEARVVMNDSTEPNAIAAATELAGAAPAADSSIDDRIARNT